MSDTDGNDFTLGDLRQTIEEKYKPVKIGLGELGSAKLLQTARLSDAKQEELMDMQSQFKELQSEGQTLNAAARDITPEQVEEFRKGYVDEHGEEPTEDEVDTWKKAEGSREVSIEEVRAFKRKTVSVVESMFKIVAASPEDADRLIEACNHDELLLMEVFTRYSKKTKLGEASASSGSSETTAGPSTPTSESSTASTSEQ